MKIYFVGICGVSMSSLAIMAKQRGAQVCGYDAAKKPELLAEIEVDHEIKPERIQKSDLVVFSSAFKPDFPLLLQAKKLGKKCLCRGEFLAKISKDFQKVIAVAGSHGKSTVTAMIFHVLKVAGKNPSLHLGAYLKENGKNFQLSGDEFFVTEACEYHDNFLFLRPYLGVVTNVEPEHLDYFQTFSNEKKSFKKFVANCDIAVCSTNLRCKNLRLDRFKRLCFEVYENKKRLLRLKLKTMGSYNAQNALFAIEACRRFGIQLWQIKLGLESFEGLQKRCERVNSVLKAKVFLDYAHHPHEIQALTKSALLLPGKKICVFQPHTYSRTREFLHEFASALSKFDEVILFKTFAAREQPDPEIEEKLLAEISKQKDCVLFFDSGALFQKLASFDEKDTVFIVGAGDLPEILQSEKIIWR